MENKKESLFGVISLFLIVGIVLLVYAMWWGPFAKYSQSLYSARNMNVSASGDAYVKPDVALLSFSVVSEGKDTQKIADDNNKKITEAIELAKEVGIPEEDIQTSQYSLEPIYAQQPSYGAEVFVPSIASYRLSQSVVIKIRDFALISDMLAKLPTIGINRIGGLSFDVEDQETALAQARDEAFSRAKEKAENIAKQSGVKLGKIMNVSEYSDSPYGYARGYGLGGDSAMSLPVAAPTIEPGAQKVSVNVSLTYAIK